MEGELELKLRKIYCPGTFIQPPQLALHFVANCNANCDWPDVSGEFIFLSLNTSSHLYIFGYLWTNGLRREMLVYKDALLCKIYIVWNF